MPSPADLPLVGLFNAVVARFAAEAAAEDPPATPAPQTFGWRKPPEQGPVPRIVWVPGDGSNAAEIIGTGYSTEEGRALFAIREVFTVYLLAVDLTQLESELHQYQAVRLLADYWLRCAYLAATANFHVDSIAWVDDVSLRRRGAALRIVCSIDGAIPDRVLTYLSDVAAHEDGQFADTSEGSTWIPEEPEE